MAEKDKDERSMKERMKEDPDYRKKIRDKLIERSMKDNYDALKKLSKE